MGDIAVGSADLERALDEEVVRTHLASRFAKDVERAHQVYSRDAVLLVPQFGKTIVGRDDITQERKQQPHRELIKIDIVVGQDDLWVAECVFKQGKKKMMLVSVMGFHEGQIATEREYICELAAQ